MNNVEDDDAKVDLFKFESLPTERPVFQLIKSEAYQLEKKKSSKGEETTMMSHSKKNAVSDSAISSRTDDSNSNLNSSAISASGLYFNKADAKLFTEEYMDYLYENVLREYMRLYKLIKEYFCFLKRIKVYEEYTKQQFSSIKYYIYRRATTEPFDVVMNPIRKKKLELYDKNFQQTVGKSLSGFQMHPCLIVDLALPQERQNELQDILLTPEEYVKFADSIFGNFYGNRRLE